MYSDSDIRAMVAVESGLIDRRIFSDEGLYKLELERIFARCWVFLAHESEIKKPHDFITTYIGEDPILVTRGSDGLPHAFLNVCRHRGSRVCLADRGNSKLFVCTYHAWTYSSGGKLQGVPMREAWRDGLNPDEWGLHPVAQIENYNGLIFGTFDPEAPPLREYLGDAAWQLDAWLGRCEGGTEVIGGVRRWTLNSNWKVAAENFIGDGYHGPTHQSAVQQGIDNGFKGSNPLGGYRHVSSVYGHGVGGSLMYGTDERAMDYALFKGADPVLDAYMDSVAVEARQRLGPNVDLFQPGHGSIFPNFSFQPGFASMHVWHPKGPGRIEVRDYAIVEKNAPQDVKDRINFQNMIRQGPAGTWEQDDSDNWEQVTQAAQGVVSQRLSMNYAMNLDPPFRVENVPGLFAEGMSDHNQRGMYDWWAAYMTTSAWSDLRAKAEFQAGLAL